jgi:hypothetical protein
MECSSLPTHSPEHQPRTKRFTEANIRQIINLVERGTNPAEIAQIVGVTLGTLKTTCSKLRISLRQPRFDNGVKLLRRTDRKSSTPTPEVAPLNACVLPSVNHNPVEQKPAGAPLIGTEPTTTGSNCGRMAMISIVMQYKGQTQTAELSLSHELIAHLAIEAEFRGVSLVNLVAQTIESVVERDHFDFLLGQIPQIDQCKGLRH